MAMARTITSDNSYYHNDTRYGTSTNDNFYNVSPYKYPVWDRYDNSYTSYVNFDEICNYIYGYIKQYLSKIGIYDVDLNIEMDHPSNCIRLIIFDHLTNLNYCQNMYSSEIDSYNTDFFNERIDFILKVLVEHIYRERINFVKNNTDEINTTYNPKYKYYDNPNYEYYDFVNDEVKMKNKEIKKENEEINNLFEKMLTELK